MSTLRDAAHALRAAIQRHCRPGQLTAIEPELTALFLAADAPEAGQEELRAKLDRLQELAVWLAEWRPPADDDPEYLRTDRNHAFERWRDERDRLIAELLAMWPRRDEDDLR